TTTGQCRPMGGQIHQGLVHPASCAAVPGAAVCGSAAPPTATSAQRSTDSSIWGFGWPGPFRLESLPLSVLQAVDWSRDQGGVAPFSGFVSEVAEMAMSENASRQVSPALERAYQFLAG